MVLDNFQNSTQKWVEFQKKKLDINKNFGANERVREYDGHQTKLLN